MKTTIMPLNKSTEGMRLKVLSLRFEESERRRMFDLGIIPGTCIKALQKSPLGDPGAYFVRGAVIALRNEDARKIIAETV